MVRVPPTCLAGLFFLTGLAGAVLHATPAAVSPVAPLVGRPLAERPVLRIGAPTDNYPYGYSTNEGQIQGFYIDLLNATAAAMNLRVEYIPSSRLDTLGRFKRGEFDVMLELTRYAERLDYAEFSSPILVLQGALYVRADSGIKEPADLMGRRLAFSSPDSLGAHFVRAYDLKCVQVPIRDTIDGLHLIIRGECDGVFAARTTADEAIAREHLTNLRAIVRPSPDFALRQCFAVHRGDTELLAVLNDGLALLRDNGEFNRIYDNWFGHFNAPLVARREVVNYALVGLSVALALALAGLGHQLWLRRRLARQAVELANQQALLQTLYDHLPLGMCVFAVTPADLHVLSINRQAETYFGLPVAQVAGRTLAGLGTDPEWRGHLTELLRHRPAPGALVRKERQLGATRRRVILTLVPMTPDAAGQARFCVLVEDITERRHLDEEIAQTRKLRAIGELVGGIAHEFNNLLTPIMLKVGEIQLLWAHDAKLQEGTKLIIEAVQRAAELSRRLLTFGHKAGPRMEQVQLRAVLQTCFSLLKLTIERRIRWEITVPDGLPPIYFSATNLNQIVLNLVLNARDTLVEKLATPRGEWTPQIHLEVSLLPAGPAGAVPSARQILGWQRLTVRDNGMGMSAEVRERIFEPFFTTKDVGQGTGLGLATVWHLVTEVSGRIEVESTAGEGTAFHIYLPMLPAPEVVAGPTAAPALPAPRAGHARIYLAEDDEVIANSVVVALQHAGHQVGHALDGAAAWAHLEGHHPGYDLLIFDVNMPGLDGIELAQRLRTICGHAGPILIISGRLRSNDLHALTEARIDTVLHKPFSIAELLEAVRECLHHRAPPG